MAKPGRKPDTLAAKVARGTVKPTADVLSQLARPSDDVPVQADFLGDECKEVWDREIEHFVSGGATRRDSAFVSMIVYRLTAFEVQAKAHQSGDEGVSAPPITLTEQLRISLEAFGMAGPKSRVTATGNGKAKGNAFASNGNRPRP